MLDVGMFWVIFGTWEGEPIRFESWQWADLHDLSLIRAREKAPQIGCSLMRTLEAVHESIMFTDSTTSIVSVDQREASEKILYARKAYSELPALFQDLIPLVTDTKDQLDFGDTARPSRIMSIPATAAIRGRKTSVVIDEADFHKDGGHGVYRAGMGRLVRGGRLSIQSTCFGRGTVLDNLMQRNDVDGEDARKVSIARYPHDVIEDPEQREKIDLLISQLSAEDAEEEFGCIRSSGGTDSFGPDLIRARTGLHGALDPDDWSPSGEAVAGYDVAKGSGRHPAVLTTLEEENGTWRQRVLFEMLREDGAQMTLPQQHRYLYSLLDRLPNLRLVIDAGGLGAHITQSLLESFPRQVTPWIAGGRPPNLPPQDRRACAVEVKRRMEASEVELVPDREQAEQFRQTRITETNVEQRGTKRRSHFDRFWAFTLAVYGISTRRVAHAYDSHGLIVIGG